MLVRFCGLTAAFVLFLATSALAAGIPTTYQAELVDLSTSGIMFGDEPSPKFFNDHAQVLFGEKDGFRAVWSPGGSLTSVPMNTADAMNNAGWVVGHGPDTAVARGINDNTYAAAYNIYTDTLIEIPTWLDDRPDLIPNAGAINQNSSGVETKLFGVNDSGLAVGRTKNGEAPRWQPFAYDINTAAYIPLPRTGNTDSSGTRQAYTHEFKNAVSANGTIIGREEVRGGEGFDAVVWTGAGTVAGPLIHQLPDETGALPGIGAQYGDVADINNHDTILLHYDGGRSGLVDGISLRTLLPEVEGGLPVDSWANLTDDEFLRARVNNIDHLWSATTGFTPIAPLLPAELAGWSLRTIHSMNNDLDLLATLRSSAGEDRMYVLHAVQVPEPTSIWAIAAGLGMLVCSARCRTDARGRTAWACV